MRLTHRTPWRSTARRFLAAIPLAALVVHKGIRPLNTTAGGATEMLLTLFLAMVFLAVFELVAMGRQPRKTKTHQREGPGS